MAYEPEPRRPIIALCWAIAVDAALLNCRFRQELREFDGINGFHLTCDPESFFFHLPMPKEPGGDPIYEVSQSIFEEYVKARWPIVCFSLDPINDQQNIADAFSRTRDLQVALAMAFSSGQLGFNQLLKYRRQLDYEASTIALNRTISAFILGNETFGWRFAPRFQTPPQEKSNLHVIANQVIRGGPGRDYQIKNSKLEAGQRELSAVIIMPSILQRVRMDVTGNWYRLSDPDETTLHTAHMLEQGRKVMELRKALSTACDSGCYRPDDLSRMMVKVNQIEAMLPMQTKTISVPYGNTLGGFNIFKKGSSGLAPFLFGYQGVDTLSSESCRNAFLIFGKNISIQETKVVAGGQRVDDDDIEILSREVIRVRLPKNLEKTVTQDGQKYVELHLGTPNGISNRLLLPFDDALVTTTGVTEIIKEETDSTGKRTSWKRSVETKNVTGPRPKCDLDKPETKATDDKKTATHEHQADGGCCIIIQTKPATGGETPQTDHDKKQPTKSEQTPKAKDATPEASAPDKSKGQADATTKPTVNQTTVVSQPNPGGAKQKDGHINRTGLRQKRQSLMNRLMHRNEE